MKIPKMKPMAYVGLFFLILPHAYAVFYIVSILLVSLFFGKDEANAWGDAISSWIK